MTLDRSGRRSVDFTKEIQPPLQKKARGKTLIGSLKKLFFRGNSSVDSATLKKRKFSIQSKDSKKQTIRSLTKTAGISSKGSRKESSESVTELPKTFKKSLFEILDRIGKDWDEKTNLEAAETLDKMITDINLLTNKNKINKATQNRFIEPIITQLKMEIKKRPITPDSFIYKGNKIEISQPSSGKIILNHSGKKIVSLSSKRLQSKKSLDPETVSLPLKDNKGNLKYLVISSKRKLESKLKAVKQEQELISIIKDFNIIKEVHFKSDSKDFIIEHDKIIGTIIDHLDQPAKQLILSFSKRSLSEKELSKINHALKKTFSTLIQAWISANNSDTKTNFLLHKAAIAVTDIAYIIRNPLLPPKTVLTSQEINLEESVNLKQLENELRDYMKEFISPKIESMPMEFLEKKGYSSSHFDTKSDPNFNLETVINDYFITETVKKHPEELMSQLSKEIAPHKQKIAAIIQKMRLVLIRNHGFDSNFSAIQERKKIREKENLTPEDDQLLKDLKMIAQNEFLLQPYTAQSNDPSMVSLEGLYLTDPVGFSNMLFLNLEDAKMSRQ